MKVTPLDVQQQQFTVRFRGFDIREVDGFLETVASELEEQIRTNNALKEELKRKDERIWEYQSMEKTLKETLMIAQETSEEMKQNARIAAETMKTTAQKEAEIIITRAQEQADKAIEQANIQITRIQEDIGNLRRTKMLFERELRSLLETHLRLLESASEPPVTPIPESQPLEP